MEEAIKRGRGKPKGLPKSGGRKKGSVNKVPTLLKEAILMAADKAGGPGGMAAYLARQAEENPSPFMALLGKVLPMQLTGAEGGAIEVANVTNLDRAKALAALIAKAKQIDDKGDD